MKVAAVKKTSLLLVLLASVSCVTYVPFTEIRQTVPAENFVRLPSGQLVYAERAGHGEPVLLLHGFGASSYAWRGVLPRLASTYRVVAPDLNGFGYTQRPEGFKSYTGFGQVAMLLSLMDELGIERAHVVGHSYGGALALTLAHQHPERVRSLVLIDAAHPKYLHERRTALAAVKPILGLYLRSVALRPENVRQALENTIHDDRQVTPEVVDAYFERLRVEGATRAYFGLTAPYEAQPAPVVFREIETPTLAIWGQDDPLISVETGLHASQELGDLRSFVVLSDTGHAPHEERPGAVVRLIREFLGGL